MPWYLKIVLGGGAALAIVKATAAAVSREHAWNGGTLKWFGILLALLIGCGAGDLLRPHESEEDESDGQDTRRFHC